MDLHLDLATAPGSSLRERVENALRDGIRSGVLAPATRLPPSRALCAQLGVSRGVVVDAYAQLVAEGYLSARRGARDGGRRDRAAALGRPTAPRSTARDPPRPQPRSSRRCRRSRAAPGARRSDGCCATRPTPPSACPTAPACSSCAARSASYLGRSRGVRTTPGEIVVTNGLRQGLGLLWAALQATGARRIAAEQPGWRGVTDTAADAGLQIDELAVDEHGLVVERLAELAGVDAVVVAPAHQFPSGAVLSPARRTELVAWAQRTGALIVEDDYDAEYRYDREPIGSLQGLAPGHVVYGGSASKSLAPGVRLGWLVLPRDLAPALAAQQLRRGGMPSSLQQLALADLIARGELDRHLRRQRRAYRRQRDALLAELARRLPEVRVHGAAAGLFVVVHLPAGVDEAGVLAAARAVGLSLEGLGGPPGLVIGYANLPEAAVAGAVDALAACVRA